MEKSAGKLTFFWRSLTANLSRLRCIRSPCSNAGPVGSWFSSTSSSCDDLVWSRSAVAKSWHCLRNSWYSFCVWQWKKEENRIFNCTSISAFYDFSLRWFLYRLFGCLACFREISPAIRNVYYLSVSSPFSGLRLPKVRIINHFSGKARAWLTLNSCSRKLKRLNSHDNSKAVRIGSLEDKAIKLGLASAL